VRKIIQGWPQWIDVRDRERDRRNEMYLRTGDKLLRYDYRAGQ